MKITYKFLFFIGMLVFTQNSYSQILDRIARRTQQKIEREAENRAQKKIDAEIDKTFDEVEDEIDGKNKDDDKENKNTDSSKNKNASNEKDADSPDEEASESPNKKPTVIWSKFDFVPGDTVIFEDGPSADEENGEFPSRWDLYKGGAEVAEFNGTPVIMYLDDGGEIIPYLKNSNEDYLPEVFTLEMDVWFGEEQAYKRYWIDFYDKKNQSSSKTRSLELYPNGLEYGTTNNKRYPGRESVNWGVVDKPMWRHISIAYTKGKFKAYMDDTRLINIPHLEGNPTGISIRSERGSFTYIKNIRIAKGGVKYYDRVLSEGKIIVNGIKFDVNKATLKPESMGPINKIYKLMEKQPELNFSVEGHTDSDGGDEANMTLSKERGKAVMNKLISMGIDSSRLKSNGFGESKPIDNNSTPEGKANNRRVEFVKF